MRIGGVLLNYADYTLATCNINALFRRIKGQVIRALADIYIRNRPSVVGIHNEKLGWIAASHEETMSRRIVSDRKIFVRFRKLLVNVRLGGSAR